MSEAKPKVVLTGHVKIHVIEYIYLNHTGPSAEERSKGSFVSQGFPLAMVKVGDEWQDKDTFEAGAPGQPDRIFLAEKKTYITVAPGWLWREEYITDKPIYEKKA